MAIIENLAPQIYGKKQIYLEAYEKASPDFIEKWMYNNSMTREYPFGRKTPNTLDKIEIGKSLVDNRANRVMNDAAINQRSNIAQHVTSDPLTYNDLMNMQQSLRDNMSIDARSGVSSSEAFNDQVRRFLVHHHPEEEEFLQNLSAQLRTGVIDTIVECIKVAMSVKSLEPDALTDINQELKRLEREKANG